MFTYGEETAENLVKEVKNQLSESNTSGDFSPALITLLRVIQHLSIPPENQFVVGAKIELKYDYMLLKFYSNGIYSLLINILEVCHFFYTSFSSKKALFFLLEMRRHIVAPMASWYTNSYARSHCCVWHTSTSFDPTQNNFTKVNC